MTGRHEKLQSIQCLRFLAVLGVVLCHCFPERAMAGAAGVDLFFVISGFIIERVGIGRTPLTFLADRVIRIYPVYWLAVWPWVVGMSSIGLEWPRLWASLTLWPIYGASYGVSYLKPAWSLSFEMLFYCGFALTLWRKSAAWFLVAAYAAALAAGLIWRTPLLMFIGSPFICEFLFGILIAKLPNSRRPWSLLLGAALFLLAAGPLGHRLNGITYELDAARVLYTGIPAALVLYGAVAIEPKLVGWRTLPLLGDASYAIYLTHEFVRILTPSPLLGAPLAIVVGLGFHLLVERPLLRLIHRAITRGRSKLGVQQSNALP